MNRYQIKSKAKEDLIIISDYIAKDNKIAALKMLQIFYDKFEKIADNPKMGTKRDDFAYLGVRFYVVKKNYLIVYTVHNETVYILRVLSSYQDICCLF